MSSGCWDDLADAEGVDEVVEKEAAVIGGKEVDDDGWKKRGVACWVV